VDVVSTVCAQTVVIASRPESLAEAALPASAALLASEPAGQGPLGELATAMAAAEHEWVLAVAADTPYLEPAVIGACCGRHGSRRTSSCTRATKDPGNPTSTYVGFEVFVTPSLRIMQGFTALDRPVTLARLAHDVKKKQDRRYYLRGRVGKDPDGSGYLASLSGSQSSALLKAAHRGNCLVVLPEGGGLFSAGTQVECVRLDMEEGTS